MKTQTEVMSSRFISKASSSGAKAVSYITRVVPINSGGSVYCGSNIKFRIGGLQSNQFLDPQNSFLRMRVSNRGHATYSLSPAGIFSQFQSIELTQAGSTLSAYHDYGTMRNMYHKKTATIDSIMGSGSVLGGELNMLHPGEMDADKLRQVGRKGESIVAGGSRIFCDPLSQHCALFNSNNMIPMFSRDSLELTYTIGNFKYSGFFETGYDTVGGSNVLTVSDNPVSDNSLEFSDFELVMSIVQTSNETTNELTRLHGGVFEYACTGVAHTSNTIGSQPGTQSVNLGLGYSALKSLDVVQTPTVDTYYKQIDRTFQDPQSHFIRNFLQSYGFSVDGTYIEALRAVKSDPAEAACMLLIQQGMLDKPGASPFLINKELFSIENAGDLIRERPGSFHASLELCVYKQRQESICSGRNTLASSTQLILDYSSLAYPCQLHTFASYEQICRLDMNGSQLWTVAM
jgi:hypothetical protein